MGLGGDDGGGGVFVISDVAALKTLADPLRQELMSLLDEPRTVKELSSRVGRPPDRLYYHLGLLERHGFVVAEDGRATERRYRSRAEAIRIDPALNVPPAVRSDLVQGLLQRAHREYAAVRPEPDGVKRSLLSLMHVRLTEDERVELTERLRALVEEYSAKADDGNGGNGDGDGDRGRRTFGLLSGVWPVADNPDDTAD